MLRTGRLKRVLEAGRAAGRREREEGRKKKRERIKRAKKRKRRRRRNAERERDRENLGSHLGLSRSRFAGTHLFLTFQAPL